MLFYYDSEKLYNRCLLYVYTLDFKKASTMLFLALPHPYTVFLFTIATIAMIKYL